MQSVCSPMMVFELVSCCFRAISLGVRLFANMMAGQNKKQLCLDHAFAWRNTWGRLCHPCTDSFCLDWIRDRSSVLTGIWPIVPLTPAPQSPLQLQPAIRGFSLWVSGDDKALLSGQSASPNIIACLTCRRQHGRGTLARMCLIRRQCLCLPGRRTRKVRAGPSSCPDLAPAWSTPSAVCVMLSSMQRLIWTPWMPGV